MFIKKSLLVTFIEFYNCELQIREKTFKMKKVKKVILVTFIA